MRSFLFIVSVLLALPCLAQVNSVYIEDFEICPDSVVTVPVYLANETPTRGFQFIITLPQGLKISGNALTREGMKYDMNLSVNNYEDNNYVVFVYPTNPVCFPADTAAILTLSFKAKSSFKGGELLLWNGRGSTMDNKAFVIEGGTTQVTVPASSLIGVPIDKKSDNDQYFNLMGTPIASPADAPVAILVTTGSDGKPYGRKIAVKH